MRRLVGVLALATTLAGCGGGSNADAGAPSEDPGHAMVALIRHELAGRLAHSWELLVREQRAIVKRELYVRCPNGQPIDDAEVVVLQIRDEMFAVPALGPTQTKAVRWRMTVPQPGADPITYSRTGHLVAQDGRWRWTLSARSFKSLRAGVCP